MLWRADDVNEAQQRLLTLRLEESPNLAQGLLDLVAEAGITLRQNVATALYREVWAALDRAFRAQAEEGD